MATQEDQPSPASRWRVSPPATSLPDSPIDLNSRNIAIELFVMELRELWRRKGEPKFSDLAARSHVSRTSLNSVITRFDRLPSEKVLAEFIRLIEPESMEEWLDRRAALAPPKAAPMVIIQEVTKNNSGKNSPTWRTLVSAVAITGVLAGGIGFYLGRGSTPDAPPPPPKLAEGTDPIQAQCANDTMLVNSIDVPNLARMEIKHSPKCGAYWGRLIRKDRLDQNKMEVRICRPSEPDKCQIESSTNASLIYTNILIARGTVDPMCVSGEIYVGTAKKSVTPNPIC